MRKYAITIYYLLYPDNGCVSVFLLTIEHCVWNISFWISPLILIILIAVYVSNCVGSIHFIPLLYISITLIVIVYRSKAPNNIRSLPSFTTCIMFHTDGENETNNIIIYGRGLLLFKPITSFLFIFTTVLYETIEYFKLFQNKFHDSKKGAQTTQRYNYVAIPSLHVYQLLTWFKFRWCHFHFLNSIRYESQSSKSMYFRIILIHVIDIRHF